MAIGRRKPEQQTVWVNQYQLPKDQGHPFYQPVEKSMILPVVAS